MLDNETVMSLWGHYLNDLGQHNLREMYAAFRAANHHSADLDFHAAKGVENKKRVIQAFQGWVKGQPQYDGKHEHVQIEEEAEVFTECTIGAMKYRRAQKEENLQTAASFFLAKTDERGEMYMVCQANNFLRHKPPGMDVAHYMDGGGEIFVECWWLLSPQTTPSIEQEPLCTLKSKLPLVVWPSKATDVKLDVHSGDGLIPRVWPARSIHPTPVCGKYRLECYSACRRITMIC